MTRPRSRLRTHRWPACRRPGTIPGRRFALVLVLATIVCSGGVAVADENATQKVAATVYAPGQYPTLEFVTIGTLESDPQKCPIYTGPENNFLGPTGLTGTGSLPPTTWPLSSVLACLSTPVSISDVTQVTVLKLAGNPEAAQPSQLSANDLKNPSDFQLVAQSPVISSDGSNIIYNRPSRGPTDAGQEGDYVLAANPTPFLLDVFEGPRLTVTVTASRKKILEGATVSFGEMLSPPNQTGLAYSWNFDGAAPNSSSRSPSVTFEHLGSYPVTLQVTDSAGGGGTGTTTITVGPPLSPGSGSHKRAGSGISPKSKSPNGPQKSGGATVGAPAGKSTPNSSGTTPTHNHKSNASNQSPSKHSKPTVRKPKGEARNQAAARAKLSTPAPAAHSAQAPLITGRLVSDVQLLPTDASPLVQSTPASVATAPPAREAIRASLLPGLAGALSIVLLFTLGAGRELRGRHGWRGWRKLRAEH